MNTTLSDNVLYAQSERVVFFCPREGYELHLGVSVKDIKSLFVTVPVRGMNCIDVFYNKNYEENRLPSP